MLLVSFYLQIICRDQECPLITFLFRDRSGKTYTRRASARNEELAFPSTGVSSFFRGPMTHDLLMTHRPGWHRLTS